VYVYDDAENVRGTKMCDGFKVREKNKISMENDNSALKNTNFSLP